MLRLAQRIEELKVPRGHLAIFWLAQAGFVYKTSNGSVIFIDPYLSDYVYRMFGFKRLMGTPIEADEVDADLVVSTHAHGDHLDLDALPVLARVARLRFVGAPDCVPEYQKLGLPTGKYMQLDKGATLKFDGFSLTGVYADHGPSTPHALGIILESEGIRVWQVGDTAYRPEMMEPIFQMHPDIIIPPINGAFGNMDGIEAAKLAHDAGAKVAIPCHFWMFAEHNGNPLQFIKACQEYAYEVKPVLLSQGELFIYPS
ncbi:MAG: MBL fold metallo-hydrolase [Chloroflexi bacterium]|nr:MBL fold metallo-hydrolase [Chloroflexota bacterium]